jgi:hypothetical protein
LTSRTAIGIVRFVTTSPPSLHYAPRPRHRRIRAQWLVLLGIAAALVTIMKWGPRLWRGLEIHYYTRQCLQFETPADSIVFNGPPDSPVQVRVVASPWTKLDAAFTGAQPQSQGTVLLHELTSPCGHRRLVAVNLMFLYSGMYRSHSLPLPPGGGPQRSVFAVEIIDPDRPLAGRMFDPFGPHFELLCLDRTAVKYAKLDAKDNSHFTFKVKTNGQWFIADGWLCDDDRLKIEQRPNPITPPVPPTTALSP